MLIILGSCIPESIEISKDIESIKQLSFEEPSGLGLSADSKSLYCVSDRGQVYNISFQGNTIKKLPISGDDLEGVCVNSDDGSIYVVEELLGNIHHYSSSGQFIREIKILETHDNNGLEGISYDSKRKSLYVLKEKNKGELIRYSLISNTITQRQQLTFASDYSGIFYNKFTDNLWILSDESSAIYKCDINARVIDVYQIPFTNMEGIVVSENEDYAYLVSDPQNSLIKIRLEK
jgi:uncharacterized protein YjiK